MRGHEEPAALIRPEVLEGYKLVDGRLKTLKELQYAGRILRFVDRGKGLEQLVRSRALCSGVSF